MLAEVGASWHLFIYRLLFICYVNEGSGFLDGCAHHNQPWTSQVIGMDWDTAQRFA